MPARHFLACTAESVVAAGREIEDEAATALLVGSMPGVQIDPLPDLAALLEDGEAAAAQLRGAAAVIALVDPFTVQTEQLAERMNELAPGVPLIGGVASWAHTAGENRLANDEAIADRGVVGVALRGAVDVSVVVSQGCRPVGSPRTVTAVRGNIIYPARRGAAARCAAPGVLRGRRKGPGAYAHGRDAGPRDLVQRA